MIGLMPGIIAKIDREARIARISIPGLTDGASELPEAQFCNPIGDNSFETEIRIKEGDPVWLAFIGGDPRYPVVVGYRPRNESNGIDWRRFSHGNFQFNADMVFEVIAGTQVHVKSPQVLIDCNDAHVTGTLTVDKLLTFNGGMTGKGGEGGGAAMSVVGDMEVTGGAKFTDEVTAGDIGLVSHHHDAQGANAPTTNSKP
ncbi:phage baseplate assembly protein V [Burkholderia gladioli]|uniref:phage baseplate assembly protein V n=1 Tax=Burkholderia gladioli TaxID=28095 RepID=UPI00163F13F1|nr:phage baseplate assembly protein V [Burkholderia gladioli]